MKITRLIITCVSLGACFAQNRSGCGGVHFLRSGAIREWQDFPEQASHHLDCEIQADSQDARSLILIRQTGVKRPDWTVEWNGRQIGRLAPDELRSLAALSVPVGTVRKGANHLKISAASLTGESDDIRVEGIQLVRRSLADWLREAHVSVRVLGETGQPMPARITVTESGGVLVPLGAESDGSAAVRTGVLYTATGEASFGLSEGNYTIWASRGFEYGARQQAVHVVFGAHERLEFRLPREVDIPGWAAGDTHVHTFEFSRHGDATMRERVITLAGEGLAYAVSTEHNMLVGFDAAMRATGLSSQLTPILGVELTTARGHFNLFPIKAGATLPSPMLEWEPLWTAVERNLAPRVVILNHPRDVHSNYRPFDSSRYLTAVGEETDGRQFRGNAMEVVNSGAMYSDPLLLVRDWMAMLNSGARIAAVGSSDSHTVAAFQVGQARTYVRVNGNTRLPEPTDIASSFERGDTMVSYGLVAQLALAGRNAVVKVYGPSWNRAEKLLVYSNGEVVTTKVLKNTGAGGLKWSGTVRLAKRKQDAWIVAVVVGTGVQEPFWEVLRPYQPSTPVWQPMTLGISQAVPLDGNGDGHFECARAIAERLIGPGAREQDLAKSLNRYDCAVAAQVAFLLAKKDRLASFLLGSAQVLHREVKAAMSEVLQQWQARQIVK